MARSTRPRLLGLVLLLMTGVPSGRLSSQEGPSPTPPLIQAVQDDDSAAVASILASGADIEAVDSQGYTALMWAVRERSPDLVAKLLDAGADPNAVDEQRMTPLGLAVRSNELGLALGLMDAGALVDHRMPMGWTPLMIAAFNGNIFGVVVLRAHGADPALLNDEGESALTLASGAGHTRVANYLRRSTSDEYALVMKRLRGEGPTTEEAARVVLSEALALESDSLLALALDAGVDPDLALGGGAGVVHIAAARRSLGRLVRTALEHGADPNARDAAGLTPLMGAASPQIALALWEYGADPALRSPEGLTAAELDRRDSVTDAVATLLEALVRPPHVSDNAVVSETPRTPASTSVVSLAYGLAAAVRMPSPLLVAALLDLGAKPNNILRDSTEVADTLRTVLHLAAARCDPATIAVLLAGGADPFLRDRQGNDAFRAARACPRPVRHAILDGMGELDLTDEQGRTDLLWAAAEGEEDSAVALIEAGASLEARTWDGWTPLHFAAKNGQASVVRALLDGGADPDVTTDDGSTPLSLAAESGWAAVALTLVDEGARTDLLNDAGEGAAALATAAGHHGLGRMIAHPDDAVFLQGAASMGRLDRVRELLEQGAPPQPSDPTLGDPLQQAVLGEHEDVAFLLLDAGARSDWSPGVEFSPLHLAARDGRMSLLDEFLRRGAHPDLIGTDGWTPLMLAAHNGFYAAATLLLAAGGDPALRRSDGATALDLARSAERDDLVRLLETPSDRYALHAFAAAGRTERVEDELARGVPATGENPWGLTALWFAAREGHAEAAGALLEAGAPPDFGGSGSTTTPFVEALAGHHEDVAKLLAARGADLAAGLRLPSVSAADTVARRILTELGAWPAGTAPPFSGYTSLYLTRAAHVISDAIVLAPDLVGALLARPAAPSLTPTERSLLARYAFSQRRPELAEQLYLSGAKIDVLDDEGMAPLHWAAHFGAPDVALALLEAGADPNQLDSDGSGPLTSGTGFTFATLDNRRLVAAVLVRSGTDTTVVNARGLTPAAQAQVNGLDDVAREIVSPDLEADLALARAGGLPRTAAWLEAARGAQATAASAEPRTEQPGGQPPLIAAILEGPPGRAVELIEAGADVEASSRAGSTALHLVVLDGPATGGPLNESANLMVVRRLIEKGADVDAPDARGRTPLARAASEGTEFAAAMLWCAGADPGSTDEEGRTPVDRAREGGYERLAELMEAPECAPAFQEGLNLYAAARQNYLMGDLDDAFASARDAFRGLGPDSGFPGGFGQEAGNFAAAIATEVGLLDDARGILDTVLDQEPQPETIATYGLRARLYAVSGFYDWALRLQTVGIELGGMVWGGRVSTPAVDRARVLAALGLARLLLESADVDAAQARFEATVAAIPEVVGDAVAYAAVTTGAAIREERNPASARRVYESLVAEETAHHPGPHPHLAALWDGIGRTYRNEGNMETATAYFAASARAYRDLGGRAAPGVSTALANIGAILSVSDGSPAERYDRTMAADALLDRSTEILESQLIDNHPRLLGQAIASALVAAHAMHALEEMSAEPQSDPRMSTTLPLLLEAHRTRALLLSALASIGFSEFASSSLNALPIASQRAFLDRNYPPLRDALFMNYADAPDFADGYRGLISLKGRLVQSIRAQTALTLDADADPQAAELMDVRSRIASWSTGGARVDPAQRAQILARLTARKEELESALMSSGGATSDPLGGLVAFRRALPTHDVFLDVYEYAAGSEGRFAAVMTGPAMGPSIVPLGTGAEVLQAVDDWRDAVLQGGEADGEWQRLMSQVWEPLMASLPEGVERVWVSPDGILARIPWQLFADGGGATVAQIASARDLIILLERESERSRTTSVDVALVGGIDFDAGVEEGGQKRFAPLPGTEDEVDAIADLVSAQGLTVTRLEGAEATRAAVFETIPAARIVHLATHGFFQRSTEGGVGGRAAMAAAVDPATFPPNRNPLVESGLALAGANGSGGTLTAEEIIGLDLSGTELVVLSACETGRGTEVSGQGVMGLQASIAAAGAGGILMSLWKVPDASTAMLMTEFYQAMLVDGAPPAVALSRAQDAVRSDPRFGAPINWAAWVLVGGAS